jgi:molybdopterin synthase sulfur carrier subunit
VTSALSTRSGASGATGNRQVTVRYFAGAKAAAGAASESVSVPAGTTVDDLVSALAADHGEALARVLAAAGFLLDEVAVRDRSTVVPDGAVLDVLPPFAGG